LLERILWKFLADLIVWPHWWVCIVDVLWLLSFEYLKNEL
jgi:hypothetical protein